MGTFQQILLDHADIHTGKKMLKPTSKIILSSAYLRLLIFLPAILIPACASSSPTFLMMYSAYKLNKQDDNIIFEVGFNIFFLCEYLHDPAEFVEKSPLHCSINFIIN